MAYNSINPKDLKSLKSTDYYTLYCDNCNTPVSRKVKDIRTSILLKTEYIVCSRTCQTALSNPRKLYDAKCITCSKEFTIRHENQKFCSRSCSASYNGTNRTKSDYTKSKISKSLKETAKSKSYMPSIYDYKNCYLPISRIKTCKCHSCGFVGSYRKQQRYCNSCSHMYTESGRAKFIFTFNVYNYPDLFDLSLIDKHGWRKTKGEDKNVNGISRDHKVSVRDAIKYNYDPYYIKHPLNCELMTHEKNQSKGTKSSITYEELVRLVDEYDVSH